MTAVLKLLASSLRSEKSLHVFTIGAAAASAALMMFFLAKVPDSASAHRQHRSFSTFSFGFGANAGMNKSGTAEKNIEHKGNNSIAFTGEIRAVSLFAALSSFFVLFAAQFMAMEKRRPMLQTLGMMGFPRGGIFIFLMLESAILSIAGSAIGTITGTALACLDGYDLLNAAVAGHFSAICLFSIICTIVSMQLSAIVPALASTIKASYPSKKSFHSRTDPGIFLMFGAAGLALLIAVPLLCYIPSFDGNIKIILFSTAGTFLMFTGLALLTPFLVMTAEALATPASAYILGIPHLAIKHCASSRQWCTWLVTLSMSVGLGLYTALQIWCSSMLAMFEVPSYVPDMMVRFHDSLAGKETEKILVDCPGIVISSMVKAALAQPGLDRSVAEKMKKANAMGENTVVMGITEQSRTMLHSMEYTAGTLDDVIEGFMHDKNICIIPDTLAYHGGLSPGDSLRLKKTDSDNELTEYKIAAVARFPWIWFSKYSGVRIKYPRTSALVFVPHDSAVENLNAVKDTFYMFNIEKNMSPEQIKEHIRREAANLAKTKKNISKAYSGGMRHDSGINRYYVQICGRDEMNKSLFQRADSVIDSMSAMPLAALAFAISALMCAMCSSVISRKKEFHLLHAIGADKGMMAKTVLAEAIVIGICACALSLAAGIFYGAMACRMVDSSPVFGVTAPKMIFPSGRILPGYLAAIVLSTMTGIVFSMHKSIRHPME